MTEKLTIHIRIGVTESTWEKVMQYIGGHLIYIYEYYSYNRGEISHLLLRSGRNLKLHFHLRLKV